MNCLLKVLLILAVVCRGLTSLYAQDNPYKIRNELYGYYQRADRLCSTAAALSIADTLYSESVRLRDKKAQCLALVIPVRHYMKRKDDEKFMEAVERLKTVSRANGYLQYYYYACGSVVTMLSNRGRLLAALQKAEETKTQAFKDDYPYGIYTCINMLSNIHYARGDRMEGARYKEEALKYMLENMPDQDPTSLYLRMAEHYTAENDYDRAKDYIRKAEKSERTDGMRFRILMEKCRIFYFENRIEEFNAAYRECLDNLDGFRDIPRDGLKVLNIYKYVMDGRFAEAHALSDSLTSDIDRLGFHAMVYKKAGEWEDAYEYKVRQYLYKDSLARHIRQGDVAEFSAYVGNEILKREKIELELRNSALLLEKSRTQSELEHSNAENLRLQLANRKLEISNLKQEKERQRMELERGKLTLERERSVARNRIILLSSAVCITAMAVCWLVFSLRQRRNTVRKLREKNGELVVARDKARAADEMKSMFIQNMSHEIRTPLNAIVGFSQLLTNPEMNLEPEKRVTFSHLIEHNSDLLTTLVNDVLSISELESGKYAMEHRECLCNELCRTALSTVEHRRPDGVELRFTSEVDDGYTLVTDRKRVEQVLVNFLTNAEKYTTKGEIHLHCSLAENPGKVTFSVADTGCGIPPEQAEAVFERFVKLDSFKQGTGLGLSICRTIAGLLKGEVRLDVTYTHGARFVFILPVVEHS